MIGWIFSGVLFIAVIILSIITGRLYADKNRTYEEIKADILKENDDLFEKQSKELYKLADDCSALRQECFELKGRLEKKQATWEAAFEEKKKAQEQILKAEYEKNRQSYVSEIEQERLELKHKLSTELAADKRKSSESLEEYLDWIFNQKMEAINEIDDIKILLEDFRQKRAAINEAIVREKEIKEKEDFYRICLSEDDIKDMAVLKSISLQLRNRNAIPKLIWEVILQRPATEMIKRVLGGKTMSGIYKITYLKTGEAYVGQSTDIKTRWQNHCKTAIGLDACASSTFHTRLAADGIENYTWEVLEEVPKDKLREREKYWIEFYETQKMGLNMKAGG